MVVAVLVAVMVVEGVLVLGISRTKMLKRIHMFGLRLLMWDGVPIRTKRTLKFPAGTVLFKDFSICVKLSIILD